MESWRVTLPSWPLYSTQSKSDARNCTGPGVRNLRELGVVATRQMAAEFPHRSGGLAVAGADTARRAATRSGRDETVPHRVPHQLGGAMQIQGGHHVVF